MKNLGLAAALVVAWPGVASALTTFDFTTGFSPPEILGDFSNPTTLQADGITLTILAGDEGGFTANPTALPGGLGVQQIDGSDDEAFPSEGGIDSADLGGPPAQFDSLVLFFSPEVRIVDIGFEVLNDASTASLNALFGTPSSITGIAAVTNGQVPIENGQIDFSAFNANGVSITANEPGASNFLVSSISVVAVPVPAALPMLALALGLMGWLTTRRA